MPNDLRPGASSASLVALRASLIPQLHTLLALAAFSLALVLACALHYVKVVKNGVAAYPQEWFPSVSATIGDWFPERNLFQIGIAMTSGPRFALVALMWLLTRTAAGVQGWGPFALLVTGLVRTLSCGGWVYITSSDHGLWHDVLMITYLAATPPYMILSICLPTSSDANAAAASRRARTFRRNAALAFASCVPFMIHFYWKHKVELQPGAYTRYAFFEWGLIITDILFDSAASLDFAHLELRVIDRTHATETLAPSVAFDTTPAGAADGAAIANQNEKGGATAALDMDEEESKVRWEEVLVDEGPLSTAVQVRRFAMDVYLSYLWWTTATALQPTVFFFSVWSLSISGTEALLLTTLSPLLLSYDSVRSTFSSPVRARSALVKLHAASMVLGIGSWSVENPLLRVLAVAAGNVAASIALAVDWATVRDEGGITKKAVVSVLGLFLTLLAKQANHSNNPLWPFLNSTNGGLHVPGLLLGVLALYEFARRSPRPGAALRSLRAYDSVSGERTGRWATGVGLGCLLFAVWEFLNDTGSVIIWAWTGWPVKGPTPVPHGALVFTAAALGLLLSVMSPSTPTSPLFLFVGAAGTYILHMYADWTSFYGGLALAFFLPALLPVFAREVVLHEPGRTWGIAWGVHFALTFCFTLTAAYAFVPGGWVFRERTGRRTPAAHAPVIELDWSGRVPRDSVLALVMTGIAVGMLQIRRSSSSRSAKTNGRATSSVSLLTLTTPLLLLLVALSFLTCVLRTPTTAPTPYLPDHRIVTAGIWTVHFGLDQNMYDSTRRMSKVLKDLQVDVVGLLETDLQRGVYGHRDLTMWLQDELGMYADVGPGPNKHTWGCILLSKFPIVNTTHHLLPSPHGELAPAIHAVLDIYGVLTHVVVSHNGQEEDPLDRELQTRELARILGQEAYPHPAIFIGYVVTKPHAERPAPYKILYEDGKIFDIEPEDMNRWCEYIGWRGLYRIGYARVSRSTVTDTELQIGRFIVPSTAISPDADALPYRVGNDTLPDEWLWPGDYVRPGVRVNHPTLHKFQNFGHPLYYDNPLDPISPGKGGTKANYLGDH